MDRQLARNTLSPDFSIVPGGVGMIFGVLDFMRFAVAPGTETILAAATPRRLAKTFLASAPELSTR